MRRRYRLAVHILLAFAGLLPGLACDGEAVGSPEMTASLSETIPTVFVVRWDGIAGEMEAAFVEFGREATDLAHITTAHINDDGLPEVWLLGLKPDTGYAWRATLETTVGSWSSEVNTFTTGSVATDLPSIEVDLHDADRTDAGFLLTTVTNKDRYGAAILDLDGDYVWWSLLDVGQTVSGASLSADGRWVEFLVAEQPGELLVPDHLRRVTLDGSRSERVDLPWGVHHDFDLLDDGTLVFLAYDERPIGVGSLLGDRIATLGDDGELHTLWSQWDHDAYTGPDPTEMQTEWGHANALVAGDTSDAWYVSMHNFAAIYRIDRDSGEVQWRLGGVDTDFDIVGGDVTGFHDQHSFEVQDDRVLVFDNGPPDEYSSRAVEYVLEPGAGLAEEAWRYQPEPPLFCPVLGDVTRLPDGSVLVGFSAEGRIDHVSAQQHLLWSVRMPMGSFFWYLDHVEQLGPGG